MRSFSWPVCRRHMEVCRTFSVNGFIVSFLINQVLTQTCDSSWLLYDQTCFKYFVGQVKHSEVADLCGSRGSRLISELTDGLKNFLLSHSPQNGNPSFWYSIQTDNVEGSISRSSSGSNAPTASTSGSNGGKCYYIENQILKEGNCGLLRGFICERDSISPLATCPQDTRTIGSSCFWRSLEFQDCRKAFYTCHAKGWKLANLNSKEKQGYGIAAVILKRKRFWVGAKKEDGNLKWENGELSDPAEDENYIPVIEDGGPFIKLGLDNTTHSGAAWFAADCETLAYAICEGTPEVTSTTTTTTLPPPACPPFTVLEENGICYMSSYIKYTRFDWETARRYCQSYGGDLITYKDAAEESLITRHHRRSQVDIWIGLRREAGSNDFRWSDGTALNYTNWAPGQPKTIGNNKLCVSAAYKDQQWQVLSCHALRMFICKVQKDAVRMNPVQPTPKRTLSCARPKASSSDLQWKLYQGYCYAYSTGLNKLTWDTAKTYCKDNGAFSVSIHSTEEMQFLINTYEFTENWIGLRAKGLRSAYEWDDNTPVDFVYWDGDDDVYDANSNIDTCVSFDAEAAVWKKRHCNTVLTVICKFKENTEHVFTTAAPTPSLPGFCHKGWYTFGNNCYRMFGSEGSLPMTWEDASQNCSEMAAQLVTIHSKEEQEFLNYRLLGTKPATWIGMYGADNVYHWNDNSTVDFTNWNYDNPENSILRKCAYLAVGRYADSKGAWRVSTCTQKNPYICKTLKDPMLTEPDENVDICADPPGWLKMGSSCYMVFNGTLNQLSWLKAQTYCMHYAGNLAGVTDASVGYLLRSNLAGPAEYFWIGIRDTVNHKYKMIGTTSRMSYTNWDEYEPREISDMSNCVVMNRNGKWIIRNCDESHSFICEVNKASSAMSPNGVSGPVLHESNLICPNTSEKWTDVGGRFCYLILSGELIEGYNAVRECLTKGGTLASFHSSKEVDAVLKHITNRYRPVFIGLARIHDGSYEWFDGSAVDYVNWVDGEPDDRWSLCVVMSTEDGKWSDASCSRYYGYICSTAKVPRNISSPTKSNEAVNDVSEGLGVGVVIGIIVCILFVIIISAITVYYFCPFTQKRKKLSESLPPEEHETTEEI